MLAVFQPDPVDVFGSRQVWEIHIVDPDDNDEVVEIANVVAPNDGGIFPQPEAESAINGVGYIQVGKWHRASPMGDLQIEVRRA